MMQREWSHPSKWRNGKRLKEGETVKYHYKWWNGKRLKEVVTLEWCEAEKLRPGGEISVMMRGLEYEEEII